MSYRFRYVKSGIAVADTSSAAAWDAADRLLSGPDGPSSAELAKRPTHYCNRGLPTKKELWQTEAGNWYVMDEGTQPADGLRWGKSLTDGYTRVLNISFVVAKMETYGNVR